jgi:hypothetical protein
MSNVHTTNVFIVKPRNKSAGIQTQYYVRSDTGRILDIAVCHQISHRHIDDNNGILLRAKEISAQHLVDLVAVYPIFTNYVTLASNDFTVRR